MEKDNFQPKDIIVRHADKGKWAINKEELDSDPRLNIDESELILKVLKRDFPDLEETPLIKDGLIRSLKLGEKMFTEVITHPEFKNKGNKAVMIAVDSGKSRAQITRALATNRISQLEKQYNKNKPLEKQIKIHILNIEAEEIAKMMADSDEATWEPYGKMVEKGMSEEEAIIQWLKDMNAVDNKIDPKIHPEESAQRYKDIIKQLHQRIKTKDIPMFIFGAGHSGSLGQIKYKKIGDEMTSKDSPGFCEMYGFDVNGNLLTTKKINAYSGSSYKSSEEKSNEE